MKPGGFLKREEEKGVVSTNVMQADVVGTSVHIPAQSSSFSSSLITKDQVDAIVTERVEKALATRKNVKSDDDDDAGGFSPKLVKQLQATVGIFNTLKDFASNPLQRQIEERIGGMAANVVEKAFAPQQPPQNQDIFDRVLNSQMGAGLGAGLGQRGPELVDKLFALFGKEKAEQWVDSAIAGRGGRGKGVGGAGGAGGAGGSGMGGLGGGGGGQQGDPKQSEIDLIMSLDANNPEHITAYAQSQGGIPNDVARKMLMVHQDAFIKAGKGIVQENVQAYRPPADSYSPPIDNAKYEQQNYDQEPALVEVVKGVPDELKSRQLEPDALMTSVDNSVDNKNSETEQLSQSDKQLVQPDIALYLERITEMITNQNMVISRLENDLKAVKDNKNNTDIETVNADIEMVKKKMERADEEIFTGVRKVKNVRMGKAE